MHPCFSSPVQSFLIQVLPWGPKEWLVWILTIVSCMCLFIPAVTRLPVSCAVCARPGGSSHNRPNSKYLGPGAVCSLSHVLLSPSLFLLSFPFFFFFFPIKVKNLLRWGPHKAICRPQFANLCYNMAKILNPGVILSSFRSKDTSQKKTSFHLKNRVQLKNNTISNLIPKLPRALCIRSL